MSYKSKPCNKGCGIAIHFDESQRSKSGKAIPLEDDGQPHQCPNSDYQQNKDKGRTKDIANIDELNEKIDKILEVVIEINNKLIRMESEQQTLEGNE